jgi:hypothetical protein
MQQTYDFALTAKNNPFVSPYIRNLTTRVDEAFADEFEFTGKDPHMTQLIRNLNSLKEKIKATRQARTA